MGEDLGKFWVNQPGQLSFEIQFNRGDRVKDLRSVIAKALPSRALSRALEQVTGIPAEAQEIRANGELLNSVDLCKKCPSLPLLAKKSSSS